MILPKTGSIRFTEGESETQGDLVLFQLNKQVPAPTLLVIGSQFLFPIQSWSNGRHSTIHCTKVFPIQGSLQEFRLWPFPQLRNLLPPEGTRWDSPWFRSQLRQVPAGHHPHHIHESPSQQHPSEGEMRQEHKHPGLQGLAYSRHSVHGRHQQPSP